MALHKEFYTTDAPALQVICEPCSRLLSQMQILHSSGWPCGLLRPVYSYVGTAATGHGLLVYLWVDGAAVPSL